jgi:uncharacterized protein YjbJ (UPF0337 family)
MKMNAYILAGEWMQLRGEAKIQWRNLTDGDLDSAGGRSEEVAGLLTKKYGYTTERAHQEVDAFLKENAYKWE